MTWRGRFSSIFDKSINIVQYYSSGEEVLESAEPGLNTFRDDEDSAWYSYNFGRGVWNTSEKAKGGRNIGAIFSGYSVAGWAFKFITSADDPHCEQHWSDLLTDTECLTDVYTKQEAEAITENEQKVNPFFQPFSDTKLLSTDVATGSRAATQGQAHLLSYDMPSLSFAAGGTTIFKKDVLANANKVDMNVDLKIHGFPSERDHGNWYHSDFKDVAYLYTFEFYKNMVSRADLK